MTPFQQENLREIRREIYLNDTDNLFKVRGVYLKPYQISTMDLFAYIVDGF